jgi:SAM-dependent methyltransferase
MNEANRAVWIEQTLRSVPAGSRLLDAGAGEQQYRRFCDHLDYVSQDFAEYEPGADACGLHFERWDYGQLDIVSDITAIPEPDESFDAVLCTEVLEHVPDPVAAIGELARLVRPGGQLIVTAPFCSLTHQSPYHYATGFTCYFYEKHLQDLGFEIEETSPNGNYFDYVAQEVRRSREMGPKYGGGKASFVDRAATLLMLRMLSRFSSADRGSSELAVFGYHVRATKR